MCIILRFSFEIFESSAVECLLNTVYSEIAQ